MLEQFIKNIVNNLKVTIDKKQKYLYNFIVTKMSQINQIKLKQIYTYIFKQGGNQNGTTKKKMVKSKNTLKKINMEKRRKRDKK